MKASAPPTSSNAFATRPDIPTRNLAILITDIKDYTAKVSDGGRDEVARLQALQAHLLTPVIEHFEGTVVKTMGDALLVRFDSPTDAVLCGVTMMEVLRRYNHQSADSNRLDVRVAINSGDVEVTENDIHGEAVNITARLESISEPGEVTFTEAVYLAMNRREAPSAEVGEHIFKGIPYPIRVYRVLQGPETDLVRRIAGAVEMTPVGPVIRNLHTPTEPHSPPRPSSRRPVATIIAVAVALVAGLLLWAVLTSQGAAHFEDAKELIAQGRTTEALELLDLVHVDDPTNSHLPDAGMAAAKAHLNQLEAEDGAAAALAWCQHQIETRTYLDKLRSEVARLDALAVIHSIRAQPHTIDAWKKLEALIDRHPAPGEPALIAARSMEQLHLKSALRLYAVGLKHDADQADDRVFEFCVQTFHHLSTGHAKDSHDILEVHFADRRVTWAIDTVENASTGRVLYNAWKILKDTMHTKTEDAYTLAVIDLLDGYNSIELAEAARTFFLQNTPQDQRPRIIELHRWILNPERVRWTWNHKKEIQKNLIALEKAWPAQ